MPASDQHRDAQLDELRTLQTIIYRTLLAGNAHPAQRRGLSGAELLIREAIALISSSAPGSEARTRAGRMLEDLAALIEQAYP